MISRTVLISGAVPAGPTPAVARPAPLVPSRREPFTLPDRPVPAALW